MAETNITGMAEAINSLQAMGKNIKTPKLQKVIRQSSQRIINTARTLAPVNTGDLRDSIGFITSKDSTNLDKALIGLRREYHHAYLGVMFEFGTAERFQTNGRHTGVISKSAHPFMRPALDQNANAVTEEILKGVDGILADLAKKNNLIYK
jgi:HK97 gp10 family phage protein